MSKFPCPRSACSTCADYRVGRVSLKEKLSPMDLHRLLNDVRRRVEHEITFEGKERRIK